MKFTPEMKMNKTIRMDLIGKIYKVKSIMIAIRRLKIADVEYYLNHGKYMCTDASNFILSKDELTGMDLVMLDHVIDNIQNTCYEISKSEEIPEFYRDDLKASMRIVREVFYMDHRWEL